MDNQTDVTPEWLESVGFNRQDDEPYRMAGDHHIYQCRVWSIQVGNSVYLDWKIDADGRAFLCVCPETWRGSELTFHKHVYTKNELEQLYKLLTGDDLK